MKKKNENEKLYLLLGLIKKAGLLTAGNTKAENAVKKGKDTYTLIAADASDNTKKKFKNMLEFRNREFAIFGKKEELGRSIGENERSVIVVLEKGFADKIKLLLSSI